MTGIWEFSMKVVGDMYNVFDFGTIAKIVSDGEGLWIDCCAIDDDNSGCAYIEGTMDSDFHTWFLNNAAKISKNFNLEIEVFFRNYLCGVDEHYIFDVGTAMIHEQSDYEYVIRNQYKTLSELQQKCPHIAYEFSSEKEFDDFNAGNLSYTKNYIEYTEFSDFEFTIPSKGPYPSFNRHRSDFKSAPEKDDISKDVVNHPSHYETGKYECIDVMEEVFGRQVTEDFCIGNVFKYIYRCMRKNGEEDVEKAQWYLDRYIRMIKEDNENK